MGRCTGWTLVAGIMSWATTTGASTSVDSLGISVAKERPREFLYTDKGGAHFFGEAAAQWTRSYHGFYSHMHEFVDGWDLQLDGKPCDDVIRAEVFPDRLVRHHQGLVETIRLLDADPGGAAALLIELDVEREVTVRIAPRIDIRFVWEEVRPDYDVRWNEGERTCVIASRRHLQRTAAEDWPVWIGFACNVAWEFAARNEYRPTTYAKDAARRAMARATPFVPGAFEMRCRPGAPAVVAIVLADDAAPAAARAGVALDERAQRIAARRARMEALVDRPGFDASDARLVRAAAWCRLGMDQLVMRQRGLGIYAGYPWFTTYWGRDSFIALSGACLVTGDFATARTILATFATHQDRDPASAREGRLPNFVTVKEVQYASADGTWWWVRALRQYEKASGDVAFADSLYAVVQRALGGALRHRVDTEGFVTHGDGETWMDAGGESRPYSPRGDRAIEVQALFAQSLDFGIELARRARERADALAWQEARDRLGNAFRTRFFDPATHAPHDHLNKDGTPDTQVRPNGLLAWFVAPELFAPAQARATVTQVRDRLAYPWSVGSLVAEDPQFRPRHLALDRYFFDEAYHNGDVWLWLSGPLVSGLVVQNDPDAAWGQTSFLIDEILDRSVAGSLHEIRDAVDTPGKEEFGGAVAQAWSLSEMQRTLYEDYLGVRPDIPAGRIVIVPMLPKHLTRVEATVPAGNGNWLHVAHASRSDGGTVTRIEPRQGCDGIAAVIVVTSVTGMRRIVVVPLAAGVTHEVVLDKDDGVHLDGSTVPFAGAGADLPPRPRTPFEFHPPAVFP